MTQIAVTRNILNTFASTAVASAGGFLTVSGAPSVPTRQISGAEWKAGYIGFGQQYLLSTTIANGKTYNFNIIQQVGKYEREANITYTSTSGTAATEYAAMLAILIANCASAGITFSATPTSSGSGIVIIGNSDTAFLQVVSISSGTETIAVTKQNRVLTAAGSSATNATPRVLTAGAAHNLVVGQLYKLSISGVSGTGAADVNKAVYAIPTAATTLTLLNTSNTGTVDTTAADMIIVPVPKANQDALFAGNGLVSENVSGYDSTKSYLTLSVGYITESPQDTKPNPVCLANETGFEVTDADMNAVFVAANSALSTFGISSVPA